MRNRRFARWKAPLWLVACEGHHLPETERNPLNAIASPRTAATPFADHPGVVVPAGALVRRYGTGDTAVEALRGVSLSVERGELTAVMGPSGSGKSTLMHILAGLDRPSEGQVWIAGTDISSLNDNQLTKLRRAHIGFVFQ